MASFFFLVHSTADHNASHVSVRDTTRGQVKLDEFIDAMNVSDEDMTNTEETVKRVEEIKKKVKSFFSYNLTVGSPLRIQTKGFDFSKGGHSYFTSEKNGTQQLDSRREVIFMHREGSTLCSKNVQCYTHAEVIATHKLHLKKGRSIHAT